jgi:hypothetical protein
MQPSYNSQRPVLLLSAGVVSHVWSQVVSAVHSAEPINEESIRDMFDEACEQAHVSNTFRFQQSSCIVCASAPAI